jgi:hypothetical protein
MTALELLEEKLNEIKSSSTDMNGTIKFLETEFKELFKQSKEMEKQQIIDDYNIGFIYQIDINFDTQKSVTGEEYYEQRFNK